MSKFQIFIKTVFLFVLVYAFSPLKAQIPISKYLIGQNAWAPKEIFEVQNQIKEVKYQTIRIGGNGYENSGFIYNEAINLIDFARAVGAEPIFQMPRQLKDNDGAYKAISYINGKMKKNIKFWCIGNEPDHHNQLASPEEVFDYFTKIAAQIKRYDANAIIIGFDVASYKGKYLTRFLGGDLDLTGKIPNQNYYYLDVVSFHNYKFKDITGFESDVKNLKQVLKPINAKRPQDQQIGWAITEFNSHWIVDESLGNDFLPYTFYNGQIFAQMYDLGMREGAFAICPWSILEGGADREGTDLGMFDLVGEKYFPRSNYYHTLMLAQNFKHNYLQHQSSGADIKVIPMGDESGVSVMIINTNKSNSFACQLQLHHAIENNRDDVIAIDANLKTVIKLDMPPASTQMLIFNRAGKLTKKYTYTSKDETQKNPPKVERF